MVICQSKIHHRAYHNLTVDNHWFVFDSMESKNSGLRKVNDRSTHQGTEDPAIADGKSTTGHVLDSELAISSLGNELVDVLVQNTGDHVGYLLAQFRNRLLNAY
jgi:hypothetical protein